MEEKTKTRRKNENKTNKSNKKNPRAFNVANAVSAKKALQRNLDRAQKKELVPMVNKLEESPPPIFIVVMGPSGVGKSTLIRSLVKIYTGQNITNTNGPITVVANKKRRITFFECPLDIYSMNDLSKVADLVILMIDASYGFEMETFEFLNQLQIHGFPKVVGVLTHIDKFKANKSLQNAKKSLKHRFWTEIYKGAKMFELMGVINGKYRKHEVKRLSLYISRLKFRPLLWRNSHSYLVIDRVEDVTDRIAGSMTSHDQRDVTLYGYVRGSHLKKNSRAHLIGVGDFDIENVIDIPDPCPLPEKEKDLKKSLSKRKENLLYAPMTNTGRVTIDKDGLYIDIKNITYTKKENLYLADQNSANINELESNSNIANYKTPVDLLKGMQDVKFGLDQQLSESRTELSLFSNNPSSHTEIEEENLDNVSASFSNEVEDSPSESNLSIDDDNDDDEEEESSDENEGSQGAPFESGLSELNHSKFEKKSHLQSKLQLENSIHDYDPRGYFGSDQNIDAMKYVYGQNWMNPSQNSDKSMKNQENLSDDEELFAIQNSESLKNTRRLYQEENMIDSNRLNLNFTNFADCISELKPFNLTYVDEAPILNWEKVKLRFVTGKGWKKDLNAPDASSEDEDNESNSVGSFEDLEAHDDGKRMDEMNGNSYDSDETMEQRNDQIDEELRKLNASKKANFKSQFDISYDNKELNKSEKDKKKPENNEDDEEEEDLDAQFLQQIKQQQLEVQERSKKEFSEDNPAIRQKIEGFRQGTYVRILLNRVPIDFISNFRAETPIILGGLLPHENELGFVTARVKRHRWHKRILKSNDPVIFSIGWRRFQSIPVYSMSDQNERDRFLKYTPEHMHCTATFYGPIVPQNTGILGFQKVSNSTTDFRIALTGVVLEHRSTPQILKKLKLVGTPIKVFKNTALISGMFNSTLEVAKFEHAKIKTVSGIRGSIKKAVQVNAALNQKDKSNSNISYKPGTFRASFEDKILLSDIVICRLWVPVELSKFYNPIMSLLTSNSRHMSEGIIEADDVPKGQETDSGIPLMRTTSQLRRDESIPQETNKDSLYKPIERVKRQFSKLKIPNKLQESLPFASKLKNDKSKNRKSYLARRAVILEPEESKSRSMIQMLSTIKKDKLDKRREANSLRIKKQKISKEREAKRFDEYHKNEKKRKYREEAIEKLHKSKK